MVLNLLFYFILWIAMDITKGLICAKQNTTSTADILGLSVLITLKII